MNAKIKLIFIIAIAAIIVFAAVSVKTTKEKKPVQNEPESTAEEKEADIPGSPFQEEVMEDEEKYGAGYAENEEDDTTYPYISKETDTEKVQASYPAEIKQAVTDLEDGKFINKRDGYSITVPDGYSVSDAGNIIYLDNKKKHVALLFDDKEMYAGPADVKGYLNNITLNSIELSIGADNYYLKFLGFDKREDLQFGEYPAIKESGTAYWGIRDIASTVEIPMEVYSVLFGEQAFIACCTDEEGESSWSDVEGMLNTLTVPDDTAEEVKLESYTSEQGDKTTFKYPSDWAVTKTGLVTVIKAPEDASSPYAGSMMIFAVDAVSDYAQYSGDMEDEIISETFRQELSPDAYSNDKVVTKMDMNANIFGLPDSVYYEVTDNLSPATKNAAASFGILGNTIKSSRYCYRKDGHECMLCFISNGKADDIFAKIQEDLK